MRNQSELRNFIRMISYENRMWSWIDGMHSFFLGENNALNSFQRGDLTQVRKHIDFVNKLLNESKTINTYFNTNEEYIVRNMPANPMPLTPSELPGGDFPDLRWERFKLQMECFKKFPKEYAVPENCLQTQNMPEDPPQEDLAICCFLRMATDLVCLFSVPSMRCLDEVQRKMIAIVRQALLERGCNCKPSGMPSYTNPGAMAGRACNHYCELVRQGEEKLKEIQDKLEEAERACKEMQQEFQEGGQYFDCIELMKSNRGSAMRDKIMSLNPTNNTNNTGKGY